MKHLALLVLCLFFSASSAACAIENPTLHICTVATAPTKELEQLQESCSQNGLTLQVLGLGKPLYTAGDKLIEIQNYVKKLPEEEIVLVVEPSRALFLEESEALTDSFLAMDRPLVFAAEKGCWPKPELAAHYPKSQTSFAFLNSGAYMGYAKELNEMFEELLPINPQEPDQGAFTLYYLYHQDKVALDHNCRLFMTCYGLSKENLQFDPTTHTVTCLETHSKPALLYGNANSPLYQYCFDCFYAKDYSATRTVFLTLLLNDSIHSLPHYLNSIAELDYNKKQQNLYIIDGLTSNENQQVLKKWLQANKSLYNQVTLKSATSLTRAALCNESLQAAKKSNCDYYGLFDSSVLIATPALRDLVNKDKPIVAPLLRAIPEKNDSFSTFSLYSGNNNLTIPPQLSTGSFQVPRVHSAYLIKKEYLDEISYSKKLNDPTELVAVATESPIPQCVITEKEYGYLVHFQTPLTEKEQKEKLQGTYFTFPQSKEEPNALGIFPASLYDVVTIENQGSFYIDNVNDYIKNKLRSGVAWEPESNALIHQCAKLGTTAIDVGAHIGTHTVAMSQAVGLKGRVLAFEPQKKIFQELYMNLKLNNCANTIALHCALGAADGFIYLGQPVANNEGSRFISKSSQGEKVAIKTLDSLKLNDVSLIKVDVENSEKAFLEGARETILRCKPIMLIEIQGNYAADPDLSNEERENKKADIIATIEQMGYTVTRFKDADYIALPANKVG